MKYLFTLSWIASNAQSDIEKRQTRLFELSKNKQQRSEFKTKTSLDSLFILFNENIYKVKKTKTNQ